MVRCILVASCVASASAFRARQDSFPTDVWEEVTEVTCDQLEDRAKERMGKYRGVCGVGAEDMDSGAAGFALLRSGAKKLCKCKAVNVKDLDEDMKNIKEQGCSGGIFGPAGEMDRIYSDCKHGKLDLDDFAEGDGKLSEEEAAPAPAPVTTEAPEEPEPVEEEPEPVEEEPKPVQAAPAKARMAHEFSGPIKFTKVGGSTGVGGSREYCLTAMDFSIGSEVYGTTCNPGDLKQVWYYNMNGNGRLQVGEDLLCLEEKQTELHLAKCVPNAKTQDWSWLNGPKGSRMIKNKQSHKCPGLRYSTDLSDGKKVTSWGCTRGDNQGVQLCNKASKDGCGRTVW